MSILITGIDMPTKGNPITVAIYPDGTAEWEAQNKAGTAVHVPPHGRLIDADAFAVEMKKRQDACDEWRDDIKNGGGYGTELFYRADSFLGAMCETKLTLEKMPTIIPADPPKEEAPAKDTNVPGIYDLLYEEGGYSSNGV